MNNKCGVIKMIQQQLQKKKHKKYDSNRTHLTHLGMTKIDQRRGTKNVKPNTLDGKYGHKKYLFHE